MTEPPSFYLNNILEALHLMTWGVGEGRRLALALVLILPKTNPWSSLESFDGLL